MTREYASLKTLRSEWTLGGYCETLEMASLSELLTTRRTVREAKPTRKILPIASYRRPRGFFMPVSVCAATVLIVALVITLGVALRA